MENFTVRLLAFVAAGALLGLLVGLLLWAVDVVANPFWPVVVGIFIAAMWTGWEQIRKDV